MLEPHKPWLYHNQKVRFQIPETKQNDWADCTDLWLYFEGMNAVDRKKNDCLIVVPYLHSIMNPPSKKGAPTTTAAAAEGSGSQGGPGATATTAGAAAGASGGRSDTHVAVDVDGAHPPWELVVNRTSLLFFVGGQSRGIQSGKFRCMSMSIQEDMEAERQRPRRVFRSCAHMV
jgi:hypothetical protein